MSRAFLCIFPAFALAGLTGQAQASISFSNYTSLPVPAWSAPTFGSGPVIRDEAGNLYGAGLASRDQLPVIYRLSPTGAFTVVHQFPQGMAGTLMKDGSSGYLGVFASAVQGGDRVFRISPAGVYSEVASFDPAEQVAPLGSLIHASDGFYYGITRGLQAQDLPASVFRMSAAGAISVLARFDAGDGEGPSGGLVEGADHALYGVTANGGKLEAGQIFRVTLAGAVSVVHEFNDEDGRHPLGPLVLTADGSLYGSTSFGGGSPRPGVVFRLTAGSVFSQVSTSTGYQLSPLTLGRDGKVYGVTASSFDPAAAEGNLFRVETDGSQTRLSQFAAPIAGYPSTVTAGDDGSFYGLAGISNDQGVYQMTAAGVLSLAGKFGPAPDTNLPGPLVFAADGTCYGTKATGGPTGRGEVFRITPEKVYNRIGALPDSTPTQVLLGADGSLYGISSGYQTGDRSTVFRMTLAGEVTTLAVLPPTTFGNPSRLIQGPGGDLFGICAATDPTSIFGAGTLFKVTLNGALTSLATFTAGSGAYPSSLVYGSDGLLWGATLSGGNNQGTGRGTLFRFDLQAAVGTGLANVETFTEQTGGSPTLMQASDGNFYGTSQTGGANDLGFLFQYAPHVEPTPAHPRLTHVHDFAPGEGVAPSGLVQGADGVLYGLSAGGDFRFGTLFSFAPATGAFRSLYHFGGEGGLPSWLTPGPGGDLFGYTFFRAPTAEGLSDDLDQIFRLHVDSAPSAFELWLAAEGLTGGATGDDDHDGLTNLLEYVCGTDPHTATTLPAGGQEGIAPAPGLAAFRTRPAPLDPGVFLYTVRKEAVAGGIRVIPQVSPDLLDWTAYQDFIPTRIASDSQFDLLGASAAGRASFFRLKVVEP